MVGVLINAAAVLVGAAIGAIIGRRLPDGMRRASMCGIALAVLFIGASSALSAHEGAVVPVASLAVGGVIGGGLRLHEAAGRLLSRGGARGFVVASLVFCVGPMAILGSLQAGLAGHDGLLLAKAALDGATAVFLAATLGSTVLLSAGAVLAYEGMLALLAESLRSLLQPPVIAAVNATGGLLIVAIGLNLLDVADLPVADLLPALLVAAVLGHLAATAGFSAP